MSKESPKTDKQPEHKTVQRSEQQAITGAQGAIATMLPGQELLAGGEPPGSQKTMISRMYPAQQQAMLKRMSQTQGNRHVQRVMGASSARPHVPAQPPRLSVVQTKLTVNAPDDQYEREADNVANAVMRMPAAGSASPDESSGAVPTVQRALHLGGGAAGVSPDVETNIQSMKGGGQPLPQADRQFFEERMGADFSSVRVHTDKRATETSDQLSARAFTVGSDIAFNQGEYQPGTEGGRKLLAHELTHTLQQGGAQSVATKRQDIQRKEAPDAPSTPAAPTAEGEAQSDLPTEAEKAAAKAAAARAEAIAAAARNQGHEQASQSRTSAVTEQEGRKGALEVATQAATEAANKQVEGKAKVEAIATEKAARRDAAGEASGAKAPNSTAPTLAPPVGTPKGAKGAVPAVGGGDKAPASPDQDPGFQAMKGKSQSTATEEKSHKPAQSQADAAQAAAVQPASEVTAHAENSQVGEMQKAETPEFDAVGFKAQLMERIAALAPQTAEQADSFKEDGKLGSVKEEMKSKAGEQQNATAAPMEQAVAVAPDPSRVPPKPVTPLAPTPPGAAPTSVGAEGAVPKEKGQSQVETPMQDEAKRLDQQMSDAQITDEQLATANEPTFTAALQEKQSAKANPDKAATDYRQFEENKLTQAEAQAVAEAQTQLLGMHGAREGAFTQVEGQQQSTKSDDEKRREKVGLDIQAIYDRTKGGVDRILSELDGKVETLFNQGADQAKQAFENFVDAKMEAYKEERYGGWLGWAQWLADKVMGMPAEVNAFYVEGRQLYLDKMNGVIDNVVGLIGKTLTQAKAEIAKGKKEIQDYVNKLPDDLKEVGQKAATEMQGKFDELEQQVNEKQSQLVDTLAQKYNENLQAVDARIEELKEANKGLVQKAWDAVGGVIQTIMQLKELLLSVLAKAADAVMKIIKDPIGFLGNLLTGVKQGFENFVANIGTHLQSGLISWLTGTLGPMGIQLPDDIFSLQGIFSLVMQVLGMTWDNIRAKAVKMFGEEVVKAMETGVEIIQILITEGPMGLWRFVQDEFADLKETVIEQIKSMVIGEVIEAGVKWVMGMLGGPVGAFVKAAMAIYDMVMFFVQRASQIAGMVDSVADAVLAIAGGSVGGAAQAVENALARSVPVVIGFLASALGVGDLATKVQGIVTKVRTRIDSAIEKLLNKAKSMAKGLLRRLGIGDDKDDEDDEGADGKIPYSQVKGAVNSAVTKAEDAEIGVQRKLKVGTGPAMTEYGLKEAERLFEDIVTTRGIQPKLPDGSPNNEYWDIRAAIMMFHEQDREFADVAALETAIQKELILKQEVRNVDWNGNVKDDHPEKDRFLALLDGALSPSDADAAWNTTILGVKKQLDLNLAGKKHDPNEHYADLARMLANQLKGAEPMALWSGGIDISLYARSKGFTTLESTAAGKVYDNMKLFKDFSTLGPLWNNISTQFVNTMTGTIHVFMRTYDRTSVLFRQEVRALQRMTSAVSGVSWHVMQGGSLNDLREVGIYDSYEEAVQQMTTSQIRDEHDAKTPLKDGVPSDDAKADAIKADLATQHTTKQALRAAILRHNVKRVGENQIDDLCHKYITVAALKAATMDDLRQVDGIGQVTAGVLHAAIQTM